jgi:hypothetical protein
MHVSDSRQSSGGSFKYREKIFGLQTSQCFILIQFVGMRHILIFVPQVPLNTVGKAYEYTACQMTQ